MSASAIFLRHQALRWFVPAGVAGVIGLAASGAFSAAASTNLPPQTAAQLLADIEQAHVNGLSGTIVEKASLGLPQLPNLGGDSASDGSFASLLTGSHTVRVWLGGPGRERVALLQAVGETDVFRNGRDMWQWSSASHSASHVLLPADAGKSESKPKTPASSLTPQQLAQQALAAMNPTTVVTTDSNRRVADRAAYELVLTPRDAGSRIGSVHIAIDGQHKIPVGVQVYARGDASNPAIDVSFTQVSFAVPAAENFNFTPPKNAKVTEQKLDMSSLGGSPAAHSGQEPKVIGKGWTSVVEMPAGHLLGTPGAPAGSAAPGAGKSRAEADQLLGQLTTPVHGSWGSGRLFQSKLLTALITDDGRAFVGAVDPSALYAAAASK